MPYRRFAIGLFAAVTVLLAPSVAAGWITSHPETVDESFEVPASFADYWSSERIANVDAWTASPASGRPMLVFVHGYQQPREDFRSLAEHMHDKGYGVVIPELPYVDESEPYSGGENEMSAVKATVAWTKTTFERPVILIGYSAGGFASALAVQNGADVEGLVTDSAFVDAAQTFREVASEQTRLPEVAFFALRSTYFASSNGGRLKRVVENDAGTPTLVIHGNADDYIPLYNGETMRQIFNAEFWVVEGADHGEAWNANPEVYEARLDAFIGSALQAGA